MNSEKALCKVRRFREKFNRINYEKIESADTDTEEASPECSTSMVSS